MLVDIAEKRLTSFRLTSNTLAKTPPDEFDKIAELVVCRGLYLQSVEESLLWVETDLQPILLARTDSDRAWDRAIRSLLQDAGLVDVEPICLHRMPCEGTLAVDVLEPPEELAKAMMKTEHFGLFERKTRAVFYFLPHVRSLTTLALATHEFGHLAWSSMLTEEQRRSFITQMHLAGLLSTSERGELERKKAGEIAADVFGGLVGGFAYCSTLFTYLIGKPSKWTKPHENYPPAAVRGWLARKSASEAGVPDHLFDNELFLGWDYLVQESNCEPAINTIEGAAFLAEFKAVLESKGVVLAGALPDFTRNEMGRPDITVDHTASEVVAIAAEYRLRERDKFSRYSVWEREVMTSRGWWSPFPARS